MAEKDTAAAAKAAVGRQRAAHRLRLAAAAQPRPPICLKIDSLAYNRLIRLLSQAVSLSVCLCHLICIGIWAQWVITAIKYNRETDSASFGFDRYWVKGLKCLLVTPINRVLSAHAHAVLPYSGKFSYGANFRIFRMLHPLYENKNCENLNVRIFFLSCVTFDLYAPHAVASWRC